MAANTGSMSKLIEILRSKPEGVHLVRLADMVDGHKKSIANRLWEAMTDGRVCNVPDPCQHGSKRVRWCVPEHLAVCTEAVKADRQRAKDEQRVAVRQAMARRKPYVPAWKTRPASTGVTVDISAGPRVTVGPAFPDYRFKVDAPSAFFSSQPPGVYTISSGSVVERAYS